MGVDAKDRAIVAMWNHRFEIDGFLAAGEAFRNSAKGLVGRALTGPDNIDQIPELVDRGRRRVASFFASLDAQLARNRFVAGDRYTIADITAQVTLDFAAWIKLELPSGHRNATRWYREVGQRPSALSK